MLWLTQRCQLLIVWLMIATPLAVFLGFSNASDGSLESRVIIANTVDGSFLGLDVSSGKELWKISGPPLVSQSLSDLRLVTEDSDYTIVPSLDGQLYLLEKRLDDGSGETSLKALPLTVDSLFSSNFMLTENSILTGGKDNSLFAFNPMSGEVRYNCSRDGCSRKPSLAKMEASVHLQEAMILVYCVNHIVRAVHIPTGIERWNLSIRQHDLCLVHDPLSIASTALQKRIPTCVPAGKKDSIDPPISPKDPSSTPQNPNDPDVEFGLDQLLIVARTRAPFSRLLWSYQLESRIAKAWLYSSNPALLEPLKLFIPAQPHQQDDTQAAFLSDRFNSDQVRLSAKVKEVSRKKTISDFMFGPALRVPKHSSHDSKCPSRDRLVYLGQVDGNLYVQLEDSSDFPNPSQISLPRFGRTKSEDASGSEPSQSAMVGYYRATYATRPTDEMCMQPFLNKRSQSEFTSLRPGEMDQRALVPWRPISPIDRWETDRESSSSTSDSDTTRPPEAFSEWVFDSTRDLFTLLLRISEVSDRARAQSARRDSSLVAWWDKFSHTIHLCLLICVLYLTDRLFRLFHCAGEADLITICEQPNQANMMETSPRPSFHRHICSTPNQLDDAISEQQNTDTTNETNQTAHFGDDDVCDAVVDINQSTAGRERHLSISCGTQAAPIFISVYETEFKFVRCLGRGAFGRVFEVENRFDGCRYAIKRIEIKEAGEDETRFLREVRVLASLDHPGIVRYHRAWSEHPPPGWQDACDRALMGSFGDNTGMDTGCSWDNDSVPQTNESQFCQTGSTSNKADGSSHFEPSVVDDFSRSSIRFSLNRRLDDSLIVFQRDAETDSRSCTRTDQSVARSTTSNISVDRRSPRSKRNRTTSTSEPSSTTSWYLYIQMQLCSQMSLRDWLISKNQAITRPSRTELYYMFWQIVDAVAYLHAHELMHRDLKPSNILFDSANRLKLADFGLVTSFADEDVNMDGDTDAKCGIRSSSGEVSEAHDSVACSSNSVSKQNTNSLGDSGHADSWSSGDTPNLSPGNVRQKYFGIRAARRQHTNDVGTDLYMSPEQERHEQYDRKVDIFSLGLIFLELLLPFETDMERICTLLKAKQQILPNHFTADYPLESAFIKRLLDPDPNERPSAADLIHDPLLSHAKPEQPHMSAMTSVAPRTVV